MTSVHDMDICFVLFVLENEKSKFHLDSIKMSLRCAAYMLLKYDVSYCIKQLWILTIALFNLHRPHALTCACWVFHISMFSIGQLYTQKKSPPLRKSLQVTSAQRGPKTALRSPRWQPIHFNDVAHPVQTFKMFLASALVGP